MSGISERNPFVGPRPIQLGEPLYGRTTEVRELFNRLQARRIVVLHSPSGAGKSSLVQAGLIPKLKESKFDVWKPIRVNLDPSGLEGIPPGTNRYLLSVLVSLEEELPESHRRTPAQLATVDFLTYLESRPRRKGSADHSVVLLFDQFEEVLTVAPHGVDEKKAFFSAVGKALDTGKFWALFIVREDFLAALAPYRERLPTQLSNTFRLDLLGLEGAREAAEQLALSQGRTFPGVDQLIHDLSTVQVQQADGSFVMEPGRYVEPVYLQVVCRRLWAAMPPDDLRIDAEDITRYAEVSKSLGAYYAEAITKIASGDRAVERELREWVGTRLIAGGIRSQVRQEKGRSAGLRNTLIEQILSSYLVRTEQRAGANWFELSHDRLVEPVLKDNQEWEAANLHPLQVQAKLWEGARRSQALLLGAAALVEALTWAAAHAGLVTEGEREFLALSQTLRQQEAGQRRRQGLFMMALATIAVIALGMGGWAWNKQHEAEEETRRAQVSETAAHQSESIARAAQEAAVQAQSAQAQAADKEKEALTLKLEAMQKLDAAQRAAAEQARAVAIIDSARNLLLERESGLAAIVLDAVKDPATAGWRSLANETLAQPIPRSTLHHSAAIRSAAWSPDGTRIVTASDDGTARIWKADGRGDARVLKGHTERVNCAAWSPDGKRIVTAARDGTARIWNADGSGLVLVLSGHTEAITAAAWSPDGKLIVTASQDTTARVWETDGSGKSTVLAGHKSAVCSAAWSHDGRRIVTASWDESARIWSMDGTVQSTLKGHTLEVNSAVWSPDDQRIVTTSDDSTARVWRADGKGEPLVLSGHTSSVNFAAWSHDGRRIVTASSDWTARVWTAVSKNEAIILQSHRGEVLSAAWSADDRRILTAAEDGLAIITDPTGLRDTIYLQGHQRAVLAAAWSPDSRRVVTASADKSARVWSVPLMKEDAASILLQGDVKRELTIPELKQRLHDATTDCLLPAQRLKLYAESWPEAYASYTGCEREHARSRTDRDGDGVADSDDRCPDAPVGRHPAPGRPGCSEDSDDDGVRDDVDVCPTIPVGPHAHPKRPGCPDQDSDGDGVYDSVDPCPLTPAGDHPDSKRAGCPDKDSDGDRVYDSVDLCPSVPVGDHPDPTRAGCPDKDSDGDGIYDSFDLCPSVPAGPHPAPKRGCPDLDSDSDGVYDSVDSCPQDPAGPHPDPRRSGCPDKDSDSDGVYDSIDLCPDLPAGSHPDPRRPGCADRDADGDGVYDAFDLCPTVPVGATANPQRPGCPPDISGDSDGDGVPDSADLCPRTAAGPGHPDLLRRGCPAMDRDGDDVSDLIDNCPDEPGLLQNRGCPPDIDTDKDGVADKDDKCPNTPGPKANKGCPPRKYINVSQEKIAIAQKIEFLSDKEIILPKSFELLAEIASVFKARPTLVMLIEGHTADTGDLVHDMWLSERRARSVMRYLIEQGVPAERMSARGYGPKRPIASNRTPQGRATNSRVEYVIVQQ